MRFCRATMTWLLVLGALALLSASGALASGPSAGDQQYVDPLGGSTTPSSQSTPSSSQSATPSSSTSSSATVAAASSSAATSSAAATTTTTTGSAGTASAATLPRTGYDSWLAAVIGAGLAGTGLALRRPAFRR